MCAARVLLADSDYFFRAMAHRALTREGYEVVSASNGAEAVNLFEKEPFDLIIAEVAMPQLDGVQVLREIKSARPQIPVILLTESRTLGSAAIGVRAGAFDYLVKPIDNLDRLTQLVTRALEAAPKQPATVATVAGDTNPLDPPAHEPDAITVETVGPAPVEIAPEPVRAPLAPRAEFREILAPLVATIAAGKSIDEVSSAIATALAATLQAEHAAVLLAHADNQLHHVAAFGFPDLHQASLDYIQRVGDDFAWRVATGGQPVWQGPGEAGPEGGMVGVPFVFGTLVLGVGVVYPVQAHDGYPATVDDELAIISREAAVAAQMAALQMQAAQLQPYDELTGLLKREHFLIQADREFRRSWRFSQPIALVTLDLDSFDKINTKVSRDAGDTVLKQVASALRRITRSVDLVGRLGEDNFAVMLLMATTETAGVVAERLRRTIAEIELSTADGPWQVTASLGAAGYPRESCTSAYDLLALAEQALYSAKRAGRNRVKTV